MKNINTVVIKNVKRRKKTVPSFKRVVVLVILHMFINADNYKYPDTLCLKDEKLIEKNRGITKRIDIKELNKVLKTKLSDKQLTRYLSQLRYFLDTENGDSIRRLTTHNKSSKIHQIEICKSKNFGLTDFNRYDDEQLKKIFREYAMLEYLHDEDDLSNYSNTYLYDYLYNGNHEITYLRDFEEVQYVLNTYFKKNI